MADAHCEDFEEDLFGVWGWDWDLDAAEGGVGADVAFPGLHCGHFELVVVRVEGLLVGSSKSTCTVV